MSATGDILGAKTHPWRFLDFRDRLRREGLVNGFQWLDGSFLEDIETREGRAPRDLDVVTIFWGYDIPFLTTLGNQFPEFVSPSRSKVTYHLDHYHFDASFNPAFTVEQTRYWALLFSHNRQGVWKGMLRIELDTPAEDADARVELAKYNP